MPQLHSDLPRPQARALPFSAAARRRVGGPAATALACAALMMLAACSPKPAAEEPVRAVRTLTVGEQGGATLRDYAAEVRARTESRLAFRVGGKLLQRPVNAGDHVGAGQMLAQLDPADLRLGQDAAQAALRAAEVNHEQTAADFKRYTELKTQGFISAAELERRDAALKAAKAQLDQARAQAGVQGNQTAYAQLLADAPGVITEVLADPGTVVAAGTPVLRLAHDGPRDVVFAVPEDQLAVFRGLRGKPGALQVTLWSGGGFKATVREVAGAADAATRTFQVKADLPAGAAELGQTATIKVELAPADGLLRLPLAAVFERQGKSTVWVVDKSATPMSVRARNVEIARTEGDNLVLRAGLQRGDIVVTAGAHVLQAGQAVSFYRDPAAR